MIISKPTDASGAVITAASSAQFPDPTALRLRPARGLFQRLAGLHAIGQLESDEGLWITPCKGVHTVGLDYAIDVVFLCGEHRILRVVDALAPYRFAFRFDAVSVIELPAGYCVAHPDHADRIGAALNRLSS